MLISEAFELYRVEHIVYLNQSRRTEEQHQCALKRLLKFIGEDIPVASLTFEIIRKWKVSLDKDCSPTTVRGYILKLRVVIKHLNLRKVPNVIDHQMIGVPKRKQALVEYLEKEEVAEMIAFAFTSKWATKINRARNAAIIALIYASGIRLSELINMDIGDIHKDDTFTVIGKGRKPRLCFADDRAVYYINEYLSLRDDNNRALFITQSTLGRISESTVQLLVRNAAKGAKIDRHITPHTLRHSFATDLLKNNTNMLYVRDFMGHNSIQTTEMYTHVVNEDLRSIYAEKHTV